MTRTPDPHGRAAWCLQPGPEICDFCAQRFHVEAGYYCAGCDRPICPLCVTQLVLHGAVLCPACAGRGAD